MRRIGSVSAEIIKKTQGYRNSETLSIWIQGPGTIFQGRLWITSSAEPEL